MNPIFLTVDDDVVMREMTAAVLGTLPGEPTIHVAENGRRGIWMAKAYLPDVIVMDWEMPEMNGLAALKALKADPTLEHIPVVMMTAARKEADSVDLALDAGAIDFVRKPITPLELRARVSSALRIKRSSDALKQVNEDLARTNSELVEALDEVRALSELLPICSHCKEVRDDDGYWSDLESYLRKRVQTQFSHGICPGCWDTHYAEEIGDLQPG